jgi:hypothetical protein
MRRHRSRTGRALAAGAAGAALLGLGYVGLTWARYGRNPTAGGDADRLIDPFLPDPEVRERHQTVVDAPADITWAAVQDFDFRDSALVRALFRGREVLMRGRSSRGGEGGSFLKQVQALGWRRLAEEPGRELAFAAVTRPWEANVVFHGMPPEEFRSFSEPDYAKIVWTLKVEPTGERSVFSTETRVATTDAEARRKFRRYWSLMSPGILLIRRESLRLVRREAERRVRRTRSLGAATQPEGTSK